MSNVGAALAGICSLLKEKAAVTAAVGRPGGSIEVYLWPWQIVPVAAAGNLPPTGLPSGGLPARVQQIELRILLVCSGTQTSIEALCRAHRALVDNPVMHVAGEDARIVPSALAADDLAAVFAAARLRLELSSSFSLQCSA